jgi:hypothetical protein
MDMSIKQMSRIALAVVIAATGGTSGAAAGRVGWQPGVEQPKVPRQEQRHSGRTTRRRRRRERLRLKLKMMKKPPPEEPISEEKPKSESWIVNETMGAELKDKRLNKRLTTLVEQLAAQPTASIPQACGDWANTKAAYNFFDNDRVSHEGILAGHRAQCLERVKEAGQVLVLQDSTEIDYSHHPQTTGLGRLSSDKRQGFMVHNSFAVSLTGKPLGLLDQQVWGRDPDTSGMRHQRKERPIEEKESYKWLKGLRATLEDIPEVECLITVADREADVYELF